MDLRPTSGPRQPEAPEPQQSKHRPAWQRHGISSLELLSALHQHPISGQRSPCQHICQRGDHPIAEHHSQQRRLSDRPPKPQQKGGLEDAQPLALRAPPVPPHRPAKRRPAKAERSVDAIRRPAHNKRNRQTREHKTQLPHQRNPGVTPPAAAQRLAIEWSLSHGLELTGLAPLQAKGSALQRSSISREGIGLMRSKPFCHPPVSTVALQPQRLREDQNHRCQRRTATDLRAEHPQPLHQMPNPARQVFEQIGAQKQRNHGHPRGPNGRAGPARPRH